jgi:hypothetical protein
MGAGDMDIAMGLGDMDIAMGLGASSAAGVAKVMSTTSGVII